MLSILRFKYGSIQVRPTGSGWACDSIDTPSSWIWSKSDIVRALSSTVTPKDVLGPYEALSYTWGSAAEPNHILVNGKTLAVTRNLHLALHQLRFDLEDRILWVDAICINQENKNERGHQVQQMGEIFRQANRVLFWLGEGTLETDRFMDFLAILQQYSLQYSYREWSIDDEHWEVIWKSALRAGLGNSTPQQLSKLQQDCQDLLRRPWFKRVWILQEVTNAQAGLLCCGTKAVKPWLLDLAQSLLCVKPDDHCQAVLDVMPGPWKESSWWKENQDLYTLLSRFGGSKASEPLDLIYALRGMSSDARDTPSLYPDYTKSQHQVVRDTIQFIYALDDRDLAHIGPPKTVHGLMLHLKKISRKVCQLTMNKADKRNRTALIQHTSAEIRDQMFWIALSNDPTGDDVAFYIQRGHTKTEQYNEYLVAAARNGHGTKVLEIMLQHMNHAHEFTENVFLWAAQDQNSGIRKRKMKRLLQYSRYQLPIFKNHIPLEIMSRKQILDNMSEQRQVRTKSILLRTIREIRHQEKFMKMPLDDKHIRGSKTYTSRVIPGDSGARMLELRATSMDYSSISKIYSKEIPEEIGIYSS